MAAATSITTTLTDATRKEDGVLGLVQLLSPQENWAFNNFRSTDARDMVHFWHVDTLNTAQSRAVEEGASLTYIARTAPARRSNVVETVAWPFRVTAEAQAIDTWTGQSQVAYQTAKNLKDFANAIEFDLWRSTLVSAVDGTVGKMSGILQVSSDGNNHTSHASGTILNASHIRGLLQNAYVQGNGDIPTDLFLSPFSRQVFDSFVTKTNIVQYGTEQTKVIESVSVYETSFGSLKLHTHRYLVQSSDSTDRIYFMTPSTFAIAYLIKPTIKSDNLSADILAESRVVYTSLTLECANKFANVYADGFLKA